MFAPANPAEACAAAEVVDWHVLLEACVEVTGTFPVDSDRVRGHVPDRFELRTSATTGAASIIIDTNGCERVFLRDRDGAPVEIEIPEGFLSSRFTAVVNPHDWHGTDISSNRYLFREARRRLGKTSGWTSTHALTQ
jgi:hypothetical protein